MKTVPPLQEEDLRQIRDFADKRDGTLADSGTKEAALFAQGKTLSELEKLHADAQVSEHSRNEKFRDHFECIAVISLWAAFIAMLLMAIVVFVHLVMPLRFHWLTSAQLGTVKSLFTGGVLASFALGHFKKRMGTGG